MRILAVLVVVAGVMLPHQALADPVLSSPGVVYIKEDKFTGDRMVIAKDMVVYDSNNQRVLFMALREPKDKKSPGAISFHSFAPEWQFLKRRAVHALVDGERLALGDARHSGDVISHDRVSESLLVPVPLTAFRKIAQAKSVEFRVGGLEFRLLSNHIAALRRFIADPPETDPVPEDEK